ncbi:hypothetical protein LUD75_16410 [Epilithonimonas sp. JDS]|uniref:DUF6705 family protein n=1 Tax=Epilithonimonas sp. JDS TaxID=2902797 RepID=UPI001E3B4B07|nr:DUF6705 family protein [Epilithonimonas sp. JDS]MCD9856308.1 hypothetical protein [Epilithonimonas sp. JDS]
MKNILLLSFIVAIVSCKAQQTYPLSQSAVDMPENSYFKDFNNELDPYIGTWKASFNGKLITLNINKELERTFSLLGKYYLTDQLIVRYEVRDSSGTVIQTSLSNTYPAGGSVKYLIISTSINIRGNNEVNFAYAGGNCGVGGGEISLKQISSTQFYWSYYPGVTTLNDITCPPNLDYHIYLPETENLVFTKQ